MNDIIQSTMVNHILIFKSKIHQLSTKTVIELIRFKYFVCLIITLYSCYPTPKVKGFNQNQWENDLIECNNYRTKQGAPLLINQKDIVLGSNQNEIISLLGSPTRQRLDKRNRKFFFYQLNCENTIELSIRFNAIGAAKEIMIVN